MPSSPPRSCSCATVTELKRLAGGAASDPFLAGAAGTALAIIDDVHARPMARSDVDYLHDLVDAIHRDGRLAIFEHLRQDAPDCQVCAALALRVMELAEPPHQA